MNIYECQNAAKSKGDRGIKFMVICRGREIEFEWVDCWFGFLKPVVMDGFIKIDEFIREFPDATCKLL